MRLLQAFEHIADGVADGVADFGGGGGFFGLRTEFGADGVPVESAGLGVPMFVVDGLPDVVEGGELALALVGGHGGGVGEKGGGQGCGNEKAAQLLEYRRRGVWPAIVERCDAKIRAKGNGGEI